MNIKPTDIDLFNYKRRKTNAVKVENLMFGCEYPVRVQSMTNTSTTDTESSVAQILRIAERGGELVRLTTQGSREAINLGIIKNEAAKSGCYVPLVADVHFNASVADVAVKYADKVRINPGNYIDAARTFKHIEYTDEEYALELERLNERFTSFLNLCKKEGKAIRIGVNHGSLSDRIMSRYGDTPEGVVESCMEFLRICHREKFNDVVVSIKTSNTPVMVSTVRLLNHVMAKEDIFYPLHLGVTEAGDAEDGRIKSAVGIGALLADGLGDTIRVSLAEAPENEIPVAKELVNHIVSRIGHKKISGETASSFDYINPKRRKTDPVIGIGGDFVPAVISSERYQATDELVPDFSFADGKLYDKENQYNIYDIETSDKIADDKPFFLRVQYNDLTNEVLKQISEFTKCTIIVRSTHANPVGELRALIHKLTIANIKCPVIINCNYEETEVERLRIKAAADLGVLLIDGLADGIWIDNPGISPKEVNSIAFGILQATRLRISKTEYIACPGCGRTMYDLQGTLAKIKAATTHLKGLKIGVMGCIVNGPGEMADADYGYVGAARGKVSLYRKKECVEKNIPEDEAITRLLDLIENDKNRNSFSMKNEINS